MGYDWLDPQDAVLRCVETPHTPLLVGALCLVERSDLVDGAGALRVDDVRRLVAARLEGLPRYRQVLVDPPLGMGRPAWVDAAGFDIADHVRVTSVPAPGGDAGLRVLLGELLESPLDPDRPPWEVWLVDGVDGDRVAVIPKISHVAADGLAVVDFALAVLGTEPSDGVPAEVPRRSARRRPGAVALLAAGIAEQARRNVSAGVSLARLAWRPWRAVASAADLARAATSLARPAPGVGLARPVGPRRAFAWTSLPLADLHGAAREHGVTLNDLVLAVVADALVAWRPDRGKPSRPVRALVPVSIGRTPGAGNRFSLLVVDLPAGQGSPGERLRAVHAEVARCRAAGQTSIGPLLFGLGAVVPGPVLRALGPPLLRHQPFVTLAVTNVPGPPFPLYLLGARIVDAYPWITLTGNIDVIVGVASYDTALEVGITYDPDAVPDGDGLVDALVQAAAAFSPGGV